MNKLIFVTIFLLAGLSLRTVSAQARPDDDLRQFEQAQIQTQIQQLDMQTSHLRAENSLMQSETDANINALNEKEKQLVIERARIAAEAQDAAEKLHDDTIRSEVASKNNLYVSAFLIAFVVLLIFAIKTERKAPSMKDNQKAGILLFIASGLITIIATTLSNGWSVNLDFLNNMMATLSLQFIADNNNPGTYLIDISTKYLVLGCFALACYGIIVYLSIAPIPWKAKTKADQNAMPKN